MTASAGLLAGFLGGLASTGGPPLVLYLYARDMDKRVRIAVIQGVFVVDSELDTLEASIEEWWQTAGRPLELLLSV